MNEQGQTGVEDQGAASPDQQTQTQTGQPQTGKPPEIPQDLQGVAVKNQKGEVLVPLASLMDERGKRQTSEGKLKKAEDQIMLYRMNPTMGQGQSAQQGSTQPATSQTPSQLTTTEITLPDEIAKMDDDEMINAGELKKVFKNISIPSQTDNPLVSDKALETVGEQLLFSIKDDAEHVLMGGFRSRLQAEPYLLQWVQNAHPVLRPFLAYRLGLGQTQQQAEGGAQKDLQQQQSNQQTGQQGSQVNQILTNIQKPTPTSIITGSGAFNAADRFMSMSDEEFDAEIERVKQGG